MNKVILAGYVGIKPELKTITNGTQCTGFSVAINESYKDKNGQQMEKVEWINCSSYGVITEHICKSLDKGDKVLIEGKLQTKTYTDKTGVEKKVTDVVVSRFERLKKKNIEPVEVVADLPY